MNLWQNKKWTPMLLKEVDKPFDDINYIYELKYDGIRATIFVDQEKVVIHNRHGIEITYLYPELQNIKNLVKENTIFDGEIICFDKNLPSFSKLQARAHLKDKSKILKEVENNPVVFICFDILYLNKNLINLPLIERKEILNKFKNNDYFIQTFYVKEHGKKLFREIKKKGLEGIVAKKIDSKYLINTRSDNWLKIKNFKHGEFIIGGYVEEKSPFVASLILGEEKNNKLYYVGRVSIAKKSLLFKEIIRMKKIKSPFIDYENININFVKPIKKCKVNYMERTKSGSLRQPFI